MIRNYKPNEKNSSLVRSITEGAVLTLVCDDDHNPVPLLKTLLDKFKRQITLRYSACSSFLQIQRLLPVDEPALMVTALRNKEDLENLLLLLNSWKKTASKKNELKVIAVSFFDDPLLISLARAGGNVDILSKNISSKELNFKIRSSLRVLNYRSQLKNGEAESQFNQVLNEPEPLKGNLKHDLQTVAKLFEKLTLRVRGVNPMNEAVANDIDVRLLEIADKTAILEVPENLLEIHGLYLYFDLLDSLEATSLQFSLEGCEKIGNQNGRVVLQIELQSEHQAHLKSLLSFFENRKKSMAFELLGKTG